MNKKIALKSRGYYSLSVLNKEGNLVKEKCNNATDNVVTFNGAFYSFFTGGMFGNLYAEIGTGTAEITRSSTSLGSPNGGRSAGASASRSGNEVDNLDGTSTLTLERTLTFPLGAKVGTFSEVGVFSSESSGSGTMIAGQLIKDEFGNPTTITLLPDEQLIVTYTLEWTVPNTAQLVGTGSVTDAASNNYNYEIWAQPYFAIFDIGNSNSQRRYIGVARYLNFFDSSGAHIRGGAYMPSVQIPTPTHDGSGNVSVTTNTQTVAPSDYTFTNATFVSIYSDINANFQRIVNETTAPTIENNPANTQAGNQTPFLLKFSPAISKDNTETFSIAISADFTV